MCGIVRSSSEKNIDAEIVCWSLQSKLLSFISIQRPMIPTRVQSFAAKTSRIKFTNAVLPTLLLPKELSRQLCQKSCTFSHKRLLRYRGKPLDHPIVSPRLRHHPAGVFLSHSILKKDQHPPPTFVYLTQ